VDPDLTNSKCSFWHFRLDADTSMKMEAMTTFIKDQPDVKKVYLINQNYSHGHQVSKFAKEILARKRPDIQIVGDDLHPLAQVRDFAPYVAKIKASGADTVITGNWGSDLALLIKAANEAGLNAKFYTYYAGVRGTPTAIGRRAGRVYHGRLRSLQHDRRLNGSCWTSSRRSSTTTTTPADHLLGLQMLSEAMAKAKSTDPVKVALCDGGPEVQELQRRRRDAQDRPPAAAAAVPRCGTKADAKNPTTASRTRA
jgi:branched-chain amino acid transport system substrate-binding protein